MNSAPVLVPALAVVPMLEMFRVYFNEKYPCDHEDADVDQMSLDDQLKWGAYNHMLAAYNQCADLYDEAYLNSLRDLSKLHEREES